MALPAWLKTKVPPGAHIDSAQVTEVSIGLFWARAVAEDTTLSVRVKRPDIYLDGEYISDKAGGVFLPTIPVTATLVYTVEEGLSLGLHRMKVVVRDANDNVFEFDWEFCVEPTSAAR